MTVDTSNSHTSWITNLQRRFRQQILPVIADLRLAIILLLAIAIASMTGTVIEQGQSVEFYQSNYPEEPALFGFLTWKVLLLVGLNHVYQTGWFLAILVAFGMSLTACTMTRQIPALKAAQNWTFYDSPRRFQKLALSSEIPVGEMAEQKLTVLSGSLQQQGYQVFQSGEMLYARKGLIGRVGPIVVHASMLLILLGSIVGSLTGVVAQQMIPSGDTVTVQNFIDRGWLSSPERFRNWAVKVNRFWINYLPDGAIDQFYSDLSIINPAGEELTRKTIFVNEPLRYNGVVLYQTDWSISGVKVQLNQSPIFQLPMAQLQGTGQRLWGTWIPTKPDMSAGVSVIAKDLQGTLFIYDTAGEPIATVRVGGSVEVNGITLKVKELIGSTGLQIKSDPGIPLVYAGFGLLMLSSIASYVSHSQIWALSQEGMLYVGGRTNRAQVAFEREIIAIFDRVSVDSSSPLSQLKS